MSIFAPDPRTFAMRRFLLKFITICLLLFGLVYLPPVRDHLIAPFTDSLTVIAAG